MAEAWNMPKGDLMRGKKGLVMGVANDKSIAWGIASQLAAQGADMAFSYMGESLLRRVQPLADSIGVKHLIECDVTDDSSMDSAFAKLKEIYGEIDFVIHSIAFADKNELQRLVRREHHARRLFAGYERIGVFVRRRVAPRRGNDEARRLAGDDDLFGRRADHPELQHNGRRQGRFGSIDALYRPRSGPQGHPRERHFGRRHAHAEPRRHYGRPARCTQKSGQFSMLKAETSMEGVAGAALWLVSDLGQSTTGEVIHVDAGFHAVGLPDGLDG